MRYVFKSYVIVHFLHLQFQSIGKVDCYDVFRSLARVKLRGTFPNQFLGLQCLADLPGLNPARLPLPPLARGILESACRTARRHSLSVLRRNCLLRAVSLSARLFENYRGMSKKLASLVRSLFL